jgi:hypothetical protein
VQTSYLVIIIPDMTGPEGDRPGVIRFFDKKPLKIERGYGFP